MKTVFSDISTVAHMWAHKQQESARYSGGNFYYEGNTIYSYGSHFPIARHIEHNGNKAVLFTLNTYSNTTARHVQVVRHACNHLNLIYCYDLSNNHAINFSRWESEAEQTVSHLKTARKPEKYLTELNYITGQVNKYAEFFEVPIPDALKEVLSICTKEQYTEYQTKQAAQLEADRKRQERKDKAEHKKALKEWENGKSARLHLRDGFDYLRVGTYEFTEPCVETSQGVKIPMQIAKKFWNKVKDNTIKVNDFITNNHGHRFAVSEIGDIIRIGCHTFKRDYIVKFGDRLFSKESV